MTHTTNIHHFPVQHRSHKGRGRSARQMYRLRVVALLIAAAMLVGLALLLLQKKQSDQQDVAIRDLSVRLTVVEHRTEELWSRLGLPGEPGALVAVETGEDTLNLVAL